MARIDRSPPPRKRTKFRRGHPLRHLSTAVGRKPGAIARKEDTSRCRRESVIVAQLFRPIVCTPELACSGENMIEALALRKRFML